jgi:hypothetical protein
MPASGTNFVLSTPRINRKMPNPIMSLLTLRW